MSTTTTEPVEGQEQTAEQAETAKQLKEQEAAAAKEQKAAKQAEKERAKEQKAQERAAAKAEKDRIAGETKARKEAERIEKLLKDGGLERDAVTGTGPEGAVTVDDARKAVKAKKDADRANKPKKHPMTLSQRRALLRLGDGPMAPTTDMNRTPLNYLVECGLAQVEETTNDVERQRKVANPEYDEKVEGSAKEIDETYTEQVTSRRYTLTEAGEQRVKDINPKWKTWQPSKA